MLQFLKWKLNLRIKPLIPHLPILELAQLLELVQQAQLVQVLLLAVREQELF
jgi:hypothetical protein